MNLQDLRTLLDYHYWARDRLLDAIEPLTADQFNRDLGSSFKSVRETVVHTYAAEWAWHSRWRGQSPTALLTSEAFPMSRRFAAPGPITRNTCARFSTSSARTA